MISEEVGLSLEKASLDDLGRAKKVQLTKDDTTIIDGAGKKEDIDEITAPLDKCHSQPQVTQQQRAHSRRQSQSPRRKTVQVRRFLRFRRRSAMDSKSSF